MVLRFYLILFLGLTLYLPAYQGQGEGATRQEAINIALQSVASQISTTISSKLKIIKESNRDNYSKNIEQIINADTIKISFNNYHIIKESKNNKGYFVILNVDNKKLANSYATHLKQTLETISNKLQQPSIFKRYLILKKYNINELFSKIYLIESIDPTYPNIQTYKQKIEALEMMKIEYQKRLVFQINSNNSSAKDIASTLLHQASFTTSNFGKLLFNINLSPLIVTYIDKEFLGTSKATIKIVENSHTILSKTISLSGTSYISKQYLMEEILKDLEVKLKETLEELTK